MALGSIESAMTHAINNGGNNPIPGQTPPNPKSPIKESTITGGNPPIRKDVPDDVRRDTDNAIRNILNK